MLSNDPGSENTILADLDEETREYIGGILEDPAMDRQEQREFIREFLQQIDSFSHQGKMEMALDELFKQHDQAARVQHEQQQQDLEKILQHAVERDLNAMRPESSDQNNNLASTTTNSASRIVSDEELERKRAILRQYAYVPDNDEKHDGGNDGNNGKDRTVDFSNDNAQRVVDEERKRKERIQLEHQQRVDRDRKALAQQRQKQQEDKERRRNGRK